MATDQGSSTESQKTLKKEASSLAMNDSQSAFNDRLDPESVGSVEAKTLGGLANTPQTSFYRETSSSSVRDVLPPQTGPKLLLSDPNIPPSTYDCYSSKTTGQRNSSENATRAGLRDMALRVPLANQYRSPGPYTGMTEHRHSALDRQVNGTHYKDFPIQPVEFIHRNNIGFIAGNVIKYVCRYAAKDGIKDLEKAKHYIELLIEQERQDP